MPHLSNGKVFAVCRTIPVLLFFLGLLAIFTACESEAGYDPGRSDDAECGNDDKESGETCDGKDLDGETCLSLGYGAGELTCRSDCEGFRTSRCGPALVDDCGNSEVDEGELCDNTNMNDATCQSLGFGPGPLRCKADCFDYDRGSCGPPADCGDDQIQLPEICDGEDLGAATCLSLGYNEGELACLPNCGDFNTAECGDKIECANNQIDPGEVCDGTDLGQASCVSLGFPGGMLKCTSDCKDYDRSECNPPEGCDNDKKEGNEVCDGEDLDGQTCLSLGFGAGELDCLPNCSGFDTDECGEKNNCNNNQKDEGEVCDGEDLDGKSCGDFGHWGGELACLGDCSDYDEQNCIHECVKQCGDRVCGPDPVCEEDCGDCDRFSVCNDEGQCDQICDLDTISEDLVLDIFLKTVTVSGTVKLNGARMPDNANEYNTRGHVVFYNSDNGESFYISIDALGAAGYSADIFVGTYDIFFDSYDESYQDVLPDQKILLVEGVSIAADWSRNFDLKTVTVGGNVTLNGSRMPDNANEYNTRGHVIFANKRTSDNYYLSIEALGAATYNGRVFAGTYDVLFNAYDVSYQDVLPDQQNVFEREVEISSNFNRNYNLKTHTVSGNVTLNGSRMPDNENEYNRRGSVVFANQDTGENYYISIGELGVARYEADLFAGSYRVQFSSYDDSYQNVLPDQDILLEELKIIASDTAKNYNLKTVTVSGTVTLNGSRMPDNSNEYNTRGYLAFSRQDNSDVYYVSIEAEGAATYNTQIFSGTYDILFDSYDDSYQDVLPDQKISLKKCVVLTGDGSQNFNLKTVEVGGLITLNGVRMPDNENEYNTRGHVVFRNLGTGDSLYLSIEALGAARYSGVVFVSSYDIFFDSYDDSYQNVLPDQTHMLLSGQLLNDDFTRNFDLETVQVSGTVRLNGARMPDNENEYNTRGHVVLYNRLMGDNLYLSIEAQGVATYSSRIFVGTYNVDFDGYDDSYQNVLPDQKTRIRTGCFDFGDCEADPANVSGNWYFVTSNGWWPSFNFTFIQAGSVISGSFTNSQGQSGNLTNGTRSGDTIEFQIDPYCLVQAYAELQNGCMMTGWFRDIQCANTAPFTTWVAFRVD